MLTQARLKQLLQYDQDTGQFWWLVNRGPVSIGQAAGHLHYAGNQTYIRMCVDCKKYYAHHLAWLYVKGEFVLEIDHWDGIGIHNWFSNLRETTRAQNTANKITSNGVLKGVYQDLRLASPRWMAKIQVDRKQIYLGTFDSAEEAAAAYQCAADRYYGEFALHNRPEHQDKE
jgi:hypothetical protein